MGSSKGCWTSILYNRALSANDIAAIYAAEFKGSAKVQASWSNLRAEP